MNEIYTHVLLPCARHRHLPTFILYSKTHPLWPNGDAYIYKWDTDINKQMAYLQWAKSRVVKAKYELELDHAGEMCIYLGQAIFAREKATVDVDANKDIIQAYVTDESTYPESFKENKLLPARNKILGDLTDHSSDKPKMVGRQLRGGTAFECSINHANPVESGHRCYQYMTFTTQKPRDLTSPNLNSKLVK
ncbi:hypothetical protein K439DRAFT_1621901 [Ramaria rubella]|nr:hypothetical protein K439DRAFT_1621901 [Ramaria rubella]